MVAFTSGPSQLVRKKPRRAFTLVELLVVIGIIALLVGILLPTLSKARKSGYRVKCLSNLKQLGQMNVMYASENDGWYIPRYYGWAPSNPTNGWLPSMTPPPGYDSATWPTTIYYYQMYAFRQYLGLQNERSKGDADSNNDRVPANLICPMAILSLKAGDKNGLYPPDLSYGYASDFSQTTWHGMINGLKSTRPVDPATKIQWADSCNGFVKAAFSQYYLQYGEQPFSTPPVGNMIAYRHDQGVNICFWDGHCDWMPYQKIQVLDISGGLGNKTDTTNPNYRWWCVDKQF
jgi:prepilin-type N-terminal cleavage/methylation domain-containing protein/prepilin-type processing-associated H-X9-DG protein